MTVSVINKQNPDQSHSKMLTFIWQELNIPEPFAYYAKLTYFFMFVAATEWITMKLNNTSAFCLSTTVHRAASRAVDR